MSRGDRGWLGKGLAATSKYVIRDTFRSIDTRPGAVNHLAPSQQIHYLQPQQPVSGYMQQMLNQQAQEKLQWQQFLQSANVVPLHIEGVPGWTDYSK